MYNAVGIDVSKGKSTIAVLQPGGVIVRKPFDVFHTSQSLKELSNYLASLEGDTRIVMECTGRYHESMANSLSNAGFFVTVVNPHLIKNFGNNTLRKVKSDPADAKKIARYTLDNWAELRQYSCMDNTRNQLKTLNSQFSFFMKQKVAAKANLIALLDNTYPGVNKLFNSPAREDGSEKWVDYAYSFWHVDCVRKTGLKAFTVRYEAFCRKHHYIYQPSKPEELFNASKELVAVFPKETSYKLLIQQSIQQLNLASAHIEQLRREMNALASTVRLVRACGGQHNSKSNKASKCGTGRLRKTLFQVMTTLLQNAPENEPVYQFLNRKRSEGKPYYVYMTAGANKFLRIYYGKVKAHLRSLEQNE